ncbi:hypothetical protein E3N88_32663 [Mikania micrantha]|uniref:SWIM-type domain-containing protein n=1 Tax=Mikania micrantha TaxID=192012 RepID=A0A5N6M9T4_9ASTR|nr:hypothetical protein E3N88_32663 [Mikania micrantha]
MGVWWIREDGEDFDYDCTYSIENYPDYFSMEIRHGGKFQVNDGKRVYCNGRLSYVDFIPKEFLGLDVLNEIAKAFGYHDTSKMIFYYLIPGRSLDNGLRVLACYDDFDVFMALTVDHNCLALYIDHDKIVAEDGPVDEDDDGGDDNVDEDDDDDYDILDDDSFEKEDVEVDMKDFKLNFSDDDATDEDYLSNDSFGTSGSEEDDENLKRRRKALRKLRKNQQGCKDPCTFYVGQTFATNDEVKALIKKHFVETRRELRLYRNDQERVRVVCKGPIPTFEKGPNETDNQGPSDKRKKINSGKHVGPSQKDGGRKTLEDPNKCHWLLYVSRLSGEPTWMVKTYNPQHRCLPSRSVKAFTSDWIAKQILVEVESNPGIPIKAIREQVEKRFDMSVSRMKAFRAKTQAADQLMGDYTRQYKDLRDYCLEIMHRNPGTTIKLETEPEPNPNSRFRIFKRIYICLGPLKEGFKACRREIIGLDGAFMKGPFPSQLLTAVRMDPNNGIYPLAYAIVKAENLHSWSWFLSILREDLGLEINANFTFIYDRQKGIIPTIAYEFPSAQHRYCVRHILQNMKLQWRGKAYKDMLWGIATATTVEYFTKKMEELKEMNEGCYKWLSQIPPVHWTRSHFTGRAKSDVLLNNLCEVFNSRLVDGRDKPIITALEFVREYLMKRIVNVGKLIKKSDGLLTPTVTKKFEIIKKQAAKLTVKWNGGSKYQVTGFNGEQYVVDVVEKVCSCRNWELLSIPCKHEVAANWDMALNGMEVDIPEKWVDRCFWLDAWKEVYSHKVEPINGRASFRIGRKKGLKPEEKWKG